MDITLINSKVEEFINETQNIRYFANSGLKNDNYTVVFSFIEAWDGWNKKMINVWPKESKSLETNAIKLIGDNSIDYVFHKISEAIGANIEKGFCDFQERLEEMGMDSEEYGLGFEIIDFIKRDMAWACIENVIDRKGFFTKILEVTSQGRWPCSWDGNYPDGRFVVM